MKKILFSIALAALFVSSANADNWAHWRGPTGNGVSLKAKPPTSWSATKNVKWKVAIDGKGSGSPIIWEDNVFVVTATPTKKGAKAAEAAQANRGGGRRGGRGGRRRGPRPTFEMDFKLLCFNRADGKLKWEKTCVTKKPHEGAHSTNNFASASPCTDGQHVYAHFGSRGLYCYTMAGKLVWKRDDFAPMKTRASFGEGSSPTLIDDKIIVPYDHDGSSYVYALNKKTGKTIWKTARNEPTNWGTPLIVNHGGKKQIVLTGQTKARSYDLESGKELWSCGGQTDRPCASPVAIDDMVIVGSGHRGSFMAAFKLDGKGDIEDTKNVVWSVNRNTPDIASPLLSGDRLFFHKAKTGILSCHNAKTGEANFTATRIPGLVSIYASPIAAGGHVYLTGRSGTTVVIQDSKDLDIVSTNTVGETVDATPAPVDNQLFIRGEKHLFCIQEKK